MRASTGDNELAERRIGSAASEQLWVGGVSRQGEKEEDDEKEERVSIGKMLQ